jgi:hypothetical protein
MAKVLSIEPNIYEELQTIFDAAGVHAHPHKQMKSAGNMVSTWNTSGSPQKHEELVKKLFSHKDVKEFSY